MGTNQGLFLPSLVRIGQVVSEEKSKMSKANPGHLVMENAHCKFSSGELKMACT
jgi:hypothetical protein